MPFYQAPVASMPVLSPFSQVPQSPALSYGGRVPPFSPGAQNVGYGAQSQMGTNKVMNPETGRMIDRGGGVYNSLVARGIIIPDR